MAKARQEKKRYTTYLFPSHFAALQRIADTTGKSLTQVLTEALDTYLVLVGALDKSETVPPRVEDLKAKLDAEE